MEITPEIESQIKTLATHIDYGTFHIRMLVDDKDFLIENNWDETYVQISDIITEQCQSIAWMAMMVIYKDIFKIEDIKSHSSDNYGLELALEIATELHLNDDDIVYSKDNLIKYITAYVKSAEWNETWKCWSPHIKI